MAVLLCLFVERLFSFLLLCFFGLFGTLHLLTCLDFGSDYVAGVSGGSHR